MNQLLSWRPNAEQTQALRTALRRSTRVSHHLFSVVGGASVVTALALWALPGARSAVAEQVLPVLAAAVQAGPERLLAGNPLPAMASTDNGNGNGGAALQPVSYQPANDPATQAANTAAPSSVAQGGTSPVSMAQQIPARQIDNDARDTHGNASARAQALVATYLSRRYHVAEEPIGTLVKAAFQTGQATNLDPLLLLSVMAIESGFNPYAESGVGAQGLMQVMAKVHSDKFDYFGGPQAALKPLANLQVGALVLKDCIARGGSLSGGLRLYNGSTTGDDGGYSAKVLAERERLRSVSRGVKVSPLAPQGGLVKVSTSGGSAKRVHATLSASNTASQPKATAATQSEDAVSGDQSNQQLGT
jgi:soluble lytic murein transglycosylase-like protein